MFVCHIICLSDMALSMFSRAVGIWNPLFPCRSSTHCGHSWHDRWPRRYQVHTRSRVQHIPWYMKTSWHGNIFNITGPLWGESLCLVTCDSSHKKLAMWSFDVFFVVGLNKALIMTVLRVYPYSSWLLHWPWANHLIALWCNLARYG